MKKLSIRYTQDAVNDLDSIFDYISDDKRLAAAKLLRQIEEAIMTLADNPRMGSVVPSDDLSLVEPGYRRIVVKPYLIFYRIGKEELFISRVLHSKQDWMNLLFENRFIDE